VQTAPPAPLAANPPTTMAAPPTPATPAPTTSVVDPIVAAGQHYLEIVKPMNCMGGLYELVWADVTDRDGYFYEEDWPTVQRTVQPAQRDFADALVQFTNDLAAYDWPDGVQATVDDLMAEVTQEAGMEAALSQAVSYDIFVDINSTERPARSAAAVLRAKLALPSNIGDSQNWCEGIIAPATTIP
jgi:hypothetical protein